MAKLAIFEETPKKWLQFDEDTEVQLSYLDKAAARELDKDVRKIVARTGSDYQKVWDQMLAERTVHGWRKINSHNHPGLTDAAANPIEFTPENRDMLMKSCREFSLFVGAQTIDAQVFLEIQGDAKGKIEAKKR